MKLLITSAKFLTNLYLQSSMSISLKNSLLAIEIQEPGKKYHGSRFDWTGQITQIVYKNKHTFCTNETLDKSVINEYGRGLYNEFGIDTPVGYDECNINESFPKVGIGLLQKKADENYNFFKPYPVFPATFATLQTENAVEFSCEIDPNNGYGYRLNKKIILSENTCSVHYNLSNTGTKTITTNEYIHNFLSINNRPIDNNYVLKFSNDIQMAGEKVNPEEKIVFNKNFISFKTNILEEFFFSNLIPAPINRVSWKLENSIDKIGISESSNFSPLRINLWGKGHVISPEIFFEINLLPGQTIEWQRNYEVFEI